MPCCVREDFRVLSAKKQGIMQKCGSDDRGKKLLTVTGVTLAVYFAVKYLLPYVIPFLLRIFWYIF